MREARVKGIRFHSHTAFEDGIPLWEVLYDQEDSGGVCPMLWRAYAIDELEMWVQFKKWFVEQSKGEPNNVIWIRV